MAPPLRVRVAFTCLAALTAAFVVHAATGIGPRWVFAHVVFNAALLVAAGIALERARVDRRERLPWLLLAGATLTWLAGNVWFNVVVEHQSSPPVPSFADVGYLSSCLFAYGGIVHLFRARSDGFRASLWLDGLVSACAVGAVGASIVLQAVLDAGVAGGVAEVATDLAYPIADVVLLAFAAAVVTLIGRRAGLVWLVLVVSWLGLVVSDWIFLFDANGYTPGGLVDLGWLAPPIAYAICAWLPRPRVAVRIDHSRMSAAPIVFGVAASAVLAAEHVRRTNAAAVVLALAALLAILARLALAFRENARMLIATRDESETDALTGLANRRRLLLDLEAALGDGAASPPRVLLLFDLNGFKAYNDSYGHPAGDALLTRLATRLAAAVDRTGRAYRLGGDEFCALVAVAPDDVAGVEAGTSAALGERGEGFAVTTARGTVFLPAEAADLDEALRLADRRMYDDKSGGRPSAGRASSDLLLATLRERSSDLDRHVGDVATLARAVARALGLAGADVEQVGLAGELHDVGKIAIPDAILYKPGPLTDQEWQFIGRHTLIGERILERAAGLERIAPLVRSSHERFDGAGYPDRLAGEEIPLGARIVAVCDAWDAMRSDRPYRAALAEAVALAELERGAGTQFDPAVVAAFRAVVVGGSAAAA